MTACAGKISRVNLNSYFYYFTGGQWRFYASGLDAYGNPLSALPETAAG